MANELTGAAAPSAPPRARLEWLDLYRGLAVLVMIETHVVNTFLAPAALPSSWWVSLNYLNGLVAPGFLFIAGYAHGCGLRRRRAVRSRALPRLARLAVIAALGYIMHLPWREVLAGQWAAAWIAGTRMNILPCLAASIAVLVLIDRFCAGWARLAAFLALLSTVVAAPFFVHWQAGPIPLIAALNATTGSLFPVLPWAAFAFAGFVVSDAAPSWPRFAGFAAGAAAIVFALGRADLSPVSAAFFFERLGWELALVPLCAALATRWSPAFLLFAGRESLTLYVAHLTLISLLESGRGAKVSLPVTVAIFLGVIAASFAVAWAWRKFSVARADRAHRAAHRPGNSAPAA